LNNDNSNLNETLDQPFDLPEKFNEFPVFGIQFTFTLHYEKKKEKIY
jgi:hypothetical protein